MQIDLTILCAVDTVDKLSVTNVLAYIYMCTFDKAYYLAILCTLGICIC